jgi:hypothetical protein
VLDRRTSAALATFPSSLLRMAKKATHLLDPSSPIDLGPAITLFGGVVRSASIWEGQLFVIFEGGREINVAPDPNYEA